MVNPMIERLRQLVASAPANRLAKLRAEIAADPGKLRAAVAAEMMRSGAYVSRRRALCEADTGIGRRDAVRDALRVHMCKKAMLRERWDDAVQNAVGWVWVILASESAEWSTSGAIGVAARRCLRPFPAEGCDDDVGPYTQAERGNELLRRLLRKDVAKPLQSWDWVDYSASREGLGVVFVRRLLRSQSSFASSVQLSALAVFDDDWVRFAGDLPVPPVVECGEVLPSGPVSSLLAGSGWSKRPATCKVFAKLLKRQRRRQLLRSVPNNRRRMTQWAVHPWSKGVRATDADWSMVDDAPAVVVQSAPAVVRKPHPLRVVMMDDAGLVRYWSVRLQARTLPPVQVLSVRRDLASGQGVHVSDDGRSFHWCVVPPVVPTPITDGVVSNWI